MTVQISIRPSDHTFGCEPDETVLQAAMRADLMIPYGCRNGACGTCKGRILDGSVDFGAHQPSTLTDDEKRRGIALFCVARPRSDLVIEVREVRRAGDIQIKRLPCRIESIDKPVPDVAIVKLKLPSSERLQSGTRPAGCSPIRCSQHSRAAKFSASKVRSARSTCARTATSR